jgi:hypothetical protein
MGLHGLGWAWAVLGMGWTFLDIFWARHGYEMGLAGLGISRSDLGMGWLGMG